MGLIDLEFPNKGWVDAKDKHLEGFDSIRKSIEMQRPSDFDRHGLTWVAKTTGENPIVLMVATGGDGFALNSFKIDLSRQLKLPSIEFFVDVIDLVQPFDAFYFFETSERLLRAKVREFGTKRFPVKSLRCVHYLDSMLVNRIGGIDRLMDLRNSKKTPLANGLLLEFTSNVSNYEQSEDIQFQLDAMEKLGMLQPEKGDAAVI